MIWGLPYDSSCQLLLDLELCLMVDSCVKVMEHWCYVGCLKQMCGFSINSFILLQEWTYLVPSNEPWYGDFPMDWWSDRLKMHRPKVHIDQMADRQKGRIRVRVRIRVGVMVIKMLEYAHFDNFGLSDLRSIGPLVYQTFGTLGFGLSDPTILEIMHHWLFEELKLYFVGLPCLEVWTYGNRFILGWSIVLSSCIGTIIILISFAYISSAESQKVFTLFNDVPLRTLDLIQKGTSYHLRLCTAIAPFWFSTERLWIVIAPFWHSTDDMEVDHLFIHLVM